MISVAMATYNGEKFIHRQLLSVLYNLGEEDEVVISDDGSTDKTLDVIASFHDKRIRIINGLHNGIGRNFENAIRNCRGDYIFLCDQDDVWRKDKVSKVMEVLEGKKLCLVEHDAYVVDEDNNVLYPSFFKMRDVRRGVIKNIVRNTYHGCLIAFTADLLPFMWGFPKDKVCFHDQWIGVIADSKGEIVFLKERLCKYYRRGENSSSFEHLSFTRQIYQRINLVFLLMRRLK
jgi:glycosyltransferase involved in cell wall biosynthesis